MGDGKQTRSEEFQSFVVGRWPRLMRTAFLLTGEQHAAEDLVQSTLEQVFVAWRRVGSADDPEAYVRRVMINAHARRHRRRLREFLAPRDDSGLVREVADTGDRIAQADDRGTLLAALARLPARQREAVVLRYWEDLTETQTAAAMGCSVGTVKSNAAKGIAKLRAIPELAETVTHGGRK
ncbi:SigE family RNA polymerase sigma factor [Streptomyces sp. SID486]|uniref:SigE family RNA polymerase sigma factor n=1 Tax=unclassified Streptomyces TaxID=2593676 RepID=UPI00136827EE|nr:MULTISPECIES: SigE family RNA polymerase sigma factor [unclassified Streptomyces]MYW47940.1 SigE family RNA polymerase sigma factor [Streptomyces sp. SID161]MYX98589.1 SigE family RNA polymerase sigma factor [Streptomyces sp. SID486]